MVGAMLLAVGFVISFMVSALNKHKEVYDKLAGKWTSSTQSGLSIDFASERALIVEYNGTTQSVSYAKFNGYPRNIVVGRQYLAIDFPSDGQLVLVPQSLPSGTRWPDVPEMNISLQGRYRRCPSGAPSDL